MKYFDYLENSEKWDLAMFLKRIGFYGVLETTDGNNDKDQAYRFIDVLEKVRNELRKEGYTPR
jgi:hypothetical protein